MLLADTMCLLISTICGRYLWMVSSSQMIATWVTAFLICPLEAYLANCFFLSWYLLLCFKPFLGSYQKRILVSSKLIVTIGLLSGISAIKNWYHCHTAIACGFKTGSKMRTVFGRQYVNNYFVWFCFGVRNLVLNLEPLLDLPLFFLQTICQKTLSRRDSVVSSCLTGCRPICNRQRCRNRWIHLKALNPGVPAARAVADVIGLGIDPVIEQLFCHTKVGHGAKPFSSFCTQTHLKSCTSCINLFACLSTVADWISLHCIHFQICETSVCIYLCSISLKHMVSSCGKRSAYFRCKAVTIMVPACGTWQYDNKPTNHAFSKRSFCRLTLCRYCLSKAEFFFRWSCSSVSSWCTISLHHHEWPFPLSQNLAFIILSLCSHRMQNQCYNSYCTLSICDTLAYIPSPSAFVNCNLLSLCFYH